MGYRNIIDFKLQIRGHNILGAYFKFLVTFMDLLEIKVAFQKSDDIYDILDIKDTYQI